MIDDSTGIDLHSFAAVVSVATRIMTVIRERKKKMSTMLLLQQENYRAQQAKAKESRNNRLSQLVAQHRHVINMAAMYFSIDPKEVEDGIIDFDSHVALLESLFAIGGRMAILFQYYEMDMPPTECGRHLPNVPKDSQMLRVIVTDGTVNPAVGKCVITYRIKNVEIDSRNVNEEINFVYFEIRPEETNIVAQVYEILQRANRPMLRSYKEWGQLMNTPEGIEMKDDFLSDVDDFILFLEFTKSDLSNTVTFNVPEELWDGVLSTPDNIRRSSKSPEIVHKVEAVTHSWGKKIYEVLTQARHLRRESSDAGPLLELYTWRCLMTKITSIIEHIKSRYCKNFVQCLVVSKSKELKRWKEVDKSITDAYNEASDNVRYLYSVQKYLELLYRRNPNEIVHFVPALLNAIRMVFNTSRFYNNTEGASALMVKVTNQMINSCRAYLTNHNTIKVWNDAKSVMINKMKDCMRLYKTYHSEFQRIKREMEENEDEPSLEVSEMFVFGKFETFDARLEKISDVLQTTLMYSILESSKIEGIDVYAAKFRDIFIEISTKPYDVLDFRNLKFNDDYITFKHSVMKTEKEMRGYIGEMLSEVPDIYIALRLLQRLDKLNLYCLRVDKRYIEIMDMYQAQILQVRDYYNEFRHKPHIPNNMPPVSGRVVWVRQLYNRIAEPMEIFKSKEVMNCEKARRIIKHYNALSTVLVHYEMLYHEAWYNNAPQQVRSCLTLPLLVKHPRTCRLNHNFDSYIIETIRETENMWKLNLSVPDTAQIVTQSKNLILSAYETVESLKVWNDKIRMSIEKVFIPLMYAQLRVIDKAFSPALSVITWTSLEIPKFIAEITMALTKTSAFVKETTDIKNARIEIVLENIAKTTLIELPDNSVETSEFYDRNSMFRRAVGRELQTKSKRAELSTIELINKFVATVEGLTVEERYGWLDPEVALKPVGSHSLLLSADEDAAFFVNTEADIELSKVYHDCNELFGFFNTNILDALIRATKKSLEALKQRVQLVRSDKQPKPLLLTELILQIPDITVLPNVEDLQTGFNKTATTIVDVHRMVVHWGQRSVVPGAQEPGEAEGMESMIGKATYFKSVSEHKDVVRILQALQTCLLLLQPDVEQLEQHYRSYEYLWPEDREEQVKTFVNKQPLIQEIREEFIKYQNILGEINRLPEAHIIGPLEIRTGKLKLGLSVEAAAWKHLLGQYLCAAYKVKLNEMVDFIKDKAKQLEKPIENLDDVRLAMACLDEVRQNYIRIDMDLDLIEEAYHTFSFFEVEVPAEDVEHVDSLRFHFQQMLDSSMNKQQELCEVQEPFKKELLGSVDGLRDDVEQFDKDFEEVGPMVEGITPKEASERVLLFQARFDGLWERFEINSDGERLFGLEVNDYPILHQRKKELNLLNKLYGLYTAVMRSIDGYSELQWGDVDIEVINDEISDFQLRCRRLPKGMKDWQAFLDLKNKIDDFMETLPLLELMANKAMKDRHWKRLSVLTGYQFDVDSENFTLRSVLRAPLLKYKDDVEDICISAVKEKDIEAKLKQVIADWSQVELSFAPFKSRGDLLLKGQEAKDIVSALDDSLMILSSLLSNRYNAPFKKDIQTWVHKLSNSSEVLDNWIQTQNLWLYLEAVFVGGDIAKQLPAEAKRFAGIDKTWVKIMQRAREIGNIIECCVGDDTMMTILPHMLENLEACQKSLSGYLESKRLIFPRFFFVSDPALLEILGQASDSHSIQNHLLAIFDNTAKAEFSDKEYDRIIAVYSREEEKIPLEVSVYCSGGVEIWLGALLKSILESVNGIIANAYYALAEPDFDLLELEYSQPAQVGLLAIQFLWTMNAEMALRMSRMDKTIMRRTNDSFLDILNLLIEQTIKELSHYDRTKFETLVTIHLHQRDIFDGLYHLRIKTPTAFDWLKQSRFYFDEEKDETVIQITDVEFIYQNEFLGCTERLVITPLTDRCYITLSQAIGMNMGGAPAGPAGTGKTETTKDMGRALGKYVVVFNCSDQMDFRGLGRIYKGLAQSGSWGCFDEFNRIELPVLSVAAQQIAIVLQARKERKPTFIFSDGDVVTLNIEFGLFLTMNPGYAGRQELPENLKINFRTVAMMVPDRQIIIRVKLASCGFKDNITLARKFYTLYKLCEEQLSKQVHYDFGLRNILSVLRTLGAQRRAHPQDTEDATVMRVLREMNLSKLVDEDETLFISLIEDMFPGMKMTVTSHKELQRALSSACQELGLINHPEWNLKIVQFYETSLVRHGLMALGPTGSGKTKMMHTLMKALTDMGTPHREMRMNPKAITAPQMFGRLDVATNDWTDGIFSTLWRRTLKVEPSKVVWIVLDGPVDAVWIENLNSVLDDNKTLTLANGDRITMAPNSKLVFEPDNVDNASPATISRMGMVFISASSLRWMPIMERWLLTRTPQEATTFRDLFGKIYSDIELFVKVHLHPKMALLESMYIRQCIDLLQGLMDRGEEVFIFSDLHLEHLFLFALMWSHGAVLELDDRELLQTMLLEHDSKLDWPQLLEGESIFEYVVTEDGDWQHWSERIEEYEYPKDSVPEYSSILVPNVDNVRTAYLIEIIAKQDKAVLLIGEQGTAKTVMIKNFMSKYDIEYHLCKGFTFSSATTPNMVQRVIESYVDKRVGLTYGPPAGKKMTVFVDDINMPIINEWGDQVTNEIVRQVMEMGGFYSLDKPGDFYIIQDLQFLAAMIHPGGGHNDIPPRLKRQFNVFNCTLPSNKSMDKIFSTIAQGYFCEERFKSEIVEFVPKLVPLTRKVWQQTKVKMLPTPAKFHYIFNLRDLSRIWEGILYIQDPELPRIEVLLKLWVHECNRIISDRFINQNDKDWFMDNLKQTAKKELGADYDEYFPSEETYFVDFLREPPEATGDEDEEISLEAPKIYEEMPSWDFIKQKFVTFMTQYNNQVIGSGIDMVFFHDCMVHLMIISRIIRLPRGNALLVGVGGSGKQSLTRLASFIANYLSFQITMTRSYNAGNLCDDLKYLYKVSGHQGKGITFIFTDNEIKEEGFLEYLNNVLSVGEVANLFARDELDEITSALVPVMKKEYPKRPPTPDMLYDYFISRARSNLHVVLCFSPVGEKFRSRAMKFPGLISGCTIDWFFRWPSDALVEVSEHFITPFKIICAPEIKIKLTELMGSIHDGVAETCEEYYERFRRQTHVTPKSYLSFIDGYKNLYNEKYENIANMAKGMSMGLAKLVEAAQSVDVLKKELVEMNKVISVATAKAENVLKEVTVSAQAAEKVKAEVEVVKDKAMNLVNMIAKDKAEADRKLEAALPALQAAEAALQTIKPADIATVRKLGKPPYLITLIMDAVLILFQRKLDPVQMNTEKEFLQPSWAESLKMMADTRFLSNLVTYPKDKMNAELIDLLQPYLNYPGYTLENAKTTSASVAGLMQWTAAMSSFYAVNKEVMPLKANLVVQQAKLDSAQNQLAEAEATLEAKEKELQGVQAEFDAAMASKQKVLDEANKCKAKMDAAQALIDGLAEERIRWTEQSAQFKAEIERLVGDVLLLSGFLSYTGPFNQEFRANLMKTWIYEITSVKIPLTANLSIIDSLTDSATIGEWNLQGLPSDELSIQNGIIATRAPRYPLMIDPQGQGKSWIKLKEKDNGLKVTTLNDRYFRNYLEDCVSNGIPLLIEDVGEELDPAMDNVLEKNYFKVGTGLKVKVGDKEIDVSDDFRCYITTKLANPSYTPEVAARTSMIDFAVTLKGLEDQLLGRVILIEKHELEAERTNLITTVTANKRKMKELEENLLIKLTTVEGSLIDDPTVLEVLNTTTATAEDVREKLKIASVTETKINAAREEFRPVAARGSVLYFLIVDMSMVNPMYQTSLGQFLERFDISMARSEKSPVTAKRMRFIIEYLTFEVYRYIARGLYERHKYLYTLLVTLKIDVQREVLSYEELMCFIKGGAALDLNECPPKPCKWITDITWLNLVQLSNLQHFQDILQSINDNDRLWKAWFDKEAPEEEVIPDGYNNLDVFRRLLLVRSFCPDRTLSQARKYIESSLGPKYNNPVITNFSEMLEESVPLTPMLCLLSLGSDPTNSILGLAKKLGFVVQAISMGQGQEVHANRLLKECVEEGGWLLLQNTHLSVSYMDDLFNMLTEMTEYNENFRVWITAEENKKYPITLLQISIKYTNEPPSGMRAGLMGTYSRMGQDQLDYTDAVEYLPLVYAISFLHSVVQERRKFGPLGWNIPYEFNTADWYASCLFVQNHLDEMDPKKGISWSTLRYMLGEVQYGGRVTDDYDKRLLNTFTQVWFKEEMFREDFEFYSGYKIVKFKWIAEYLEYFETMAQVDPPQVYGLHPNANISYQSNVTRGILDTILSVQPKESAAGGGETRESMVSRQASDMLHRLPKDFDPFECKQRLKIMGALNPMNIFLKQEIDRMQKVISTVRKTLKDLLLAIEGTIVMNEALRDALDNIYDAKVPNLWKRGSWLSSTIGFWFTELIDRSAQFSSWIFHGRPPAFWMTGFFNCQGFLTAMRQEVARMHKGWSLDGVTVHNEVLKITVEDAKKPPDDVHFVKTSRNVLLQEGVYVYGLFLDGGGWDRKKGLLCEQPSKVLFIALPIVYIYAINSTAPKDPALYEVPVYKKPSRTDLNFITPLWLPSQKPPEHWIMRGVAMLCDIK